MCSVQFSRVPVSVVKLGQNSVLSSELMILIFPHPRLEPVAAADVLRPVAVTAVLLRPQICSGFRVSGKFGNGFGQRMGKTIARGLLEDEWGRGRLVFVFGRRSDRLVPEILFRHLGRRSVLGLVTNDEIETRLGTRVVGIGRAAVAGEAVDRSR